MSSLSTYHNRSKGVENIVSVRDLVLVHDQNCPRGLRKLMMIESVMKRSDDHIRGAAVKTQSDTGRTSVVKHSIKQLYPLEAQSQTSGADHIMNNQDIQDAARWLIWALAMRANERYRDCSHTKWKSIFPLIEEKCWVIILHITRDISCLYSVVYVTWEAKRNKEVCFIVPYGQLVCKLPSKLMIVRVQLSH